MRTRLLGLRATPASLLASSANPGNIRVTQRRCASYKIEERGAGVKIHHQHAVDLKLRKVRLGEEHQDQGKEGSKSLERAQEEPTMRKAKRQRWFRISTEKRRASAYRAQQIEFRPVTLDRLRQVETKARIRPILVSEPEKHVKAHDDDGAREVDKWGKSVKIWLDLLQREAQSKGDTGIKQAWTLIKEAEVDLPVKDSTATQFWEILLSCSELHDEVVSYAIRQRLRSSKVFKPLYVMVMEKYIETYTAAEILHWHRRFMEGYEVGRNALKKLAPAFASSRTDGGLVALRTIYADLHATSAPCYDQLISALLIRNRASKALYWHTILTANGDGPSIDLSRSDIISTFQQVQEHVKLRKGAWARQMRARLVKRAIKARVLATESEAGRASKVEAGRISSMSPSNDKGVTSTMASFEPMAASPIPDQDLTPKRDESLESTSQSSVPPAEDSTAEQVKSEEDFFSSPRMTLARRRKNKTLARETEHVSVLQSPNRGLIASLVSEMQNAGSSGLSDEFCARLYATRAVTPSWVSSFIHAFSVKKIGPLALRELALRAESTGGLMYHLDDLKAKGISMGGSKFSLIIRKLAESGNTVMLREILRGDQHPDVFDDQAAQIKILDEALVQDDHVTVHQMLNVMSMFADKPEQEYYNCLLSGNMRRRNIPEISRIADEMQAQGLRITATTIELAGQVLLRPRKVAKRPDMLAKGFDYDDLRIVSNLLLRAMEGGTNVPEATWLELFKRHGMKSLSSLERFSHATVNSLRSIRHIATYNPGARLHGYTRLMLPGRDVPRIEPKVDAIRMLLTPQRMQNIISWGFMEGLVRLASVRDRFDTLPRVKSMRKVRYRRWPSACTPPNPSGTFLCGIKVLQSLQEKGVQFNVSAIEAVLRQRLWTLFGPGRSAKRRNATAAALNPYSLLDLLRATEEMWNGRPLFRHVRHLLRPMSRPEFDLELRAQGEPFRDLEIDIDPEDDGGSEESSNEAGLQLDEDVSHGRVIAASVARFMRANLEPTTDAREMQKRRYIQAVMTVFYQSRTVGMGSVAEMRANRMALTEDQWLHLLYSWAKQVLVRSV